MHNINSLSSLACQDLLGHPHTQGMTSAKVRSIWQETARCVGEKICGLSCISFHGLGPEGHIGTFAYTATQPPTPAFIFSDRFLERHALTHSRTCPAIPAPRKGIPFSAIGASSSLNEAATKLTLQAFVAQMGKAMEEGGQVLVQFGNMGAFRSNGASCTFQWSSAWVGQAQRAISLSMSAAEAVMAKQEGVAKKSTAEELLVPDIPLGASARVTTPQIGAGRRAARDALVRSHTASPTRRTGKVGKSCDAPLPVPGLSSLLVNETEGGRNSPAQASPTAFLSPQLKKRRSHRHKGLSASQQATAKALSEANAPTDATFLETFFHSSLLMEEEQAKRNQELHDALLTQIKTKSRNREPTQKEVAVQRRVLVRKELEDLSEVVKQTSEKAKAAGEEYDIPAEVVLSSFNTKRCRRGRLNGLSMALAQRNAAERAGREQREVGREQRKWQECQEETIKMEPVIASRERDNNDLKRRLYGLDLEDQMREKRERENSDRERDKRDDFRCPGLAITQNSLSWGDAKLGKRRHKVNVHKFDSRTAATAPPFGYFPGLNQSGSFTDPSRASVLYQTSEDGSVL